MVLLTKTKALEHALTSGKTEGNWRFYTIVGGSEHENCNKHAGIHSFFLEKFIFP